MSTALVVPGGDRLCNMPFSLPKWLNYVIYVVGGLWAFLMGLAALWPVFTHQTMPEWLTERGWEHITALLRGWPYWFVSLTIILSLLALLFFSPYRTLKERDLTKLDEEVRAWADVFGFGTSRRQLENAYFGMVVTLKNSAKVTVFRPKDMDRYLILQSRLVFKDESSDAEAAEKIANQIKLELSRARLEYIFEPPLKAVTIIKKLPISNQLTENMFTEGLLEIDSAIRVAVMVAVINSKTAAESSKGSLVK